MLSTTEIKDRTIDHIVEVLADDGVVVSGIDGPDELTAAVPGVRLLAWVLAIDSDA